jgi:hypothetical protein
MCCNDFMNIRIERREAAIDHMADYVLSAGLAGATLRPLVKGGGVLDALLPLRTASALECHRFASLHVRDQLVDLRTV